MLPIFFTTQNEFRKWLQKHHKKETELLVGFYKVGSGKASMTWSQSVDQALCFGWIDGVRKTVDEESYCIRFTPRKATGIWSNINIKKVEELSKASLMTEAGHQAFSLRKEHKSGIYSHEKEPASFSADFEKQFKKNKSAWNFFSQQAPSYKKVITHWVMSAEQETTRQSRFEKAIKASEEGKRVV